MNTYYTLCLSIKKKYQYGIRSCIGVFFDSDVDVLIYYCIKLCLQKNYYDYFINWY